MQNHRNQIRILINAALFCCIAVSSYSQDWFWKNPLPQGNDINALCSAGQGVLYGVGNYGAVVKSTNGGKNWFLVESSTKTNLYGATFLTPDWGMAVGDGGSVVQTTDGGSTWTQKTIFAGATLYDVSFSDPLNGTVVGYPGIVLRTSDGGSTWKQQLAGGGDRLKAVLFTDANRGTIVGSYGVIFQTTNGGKSWGRQVDSTIRDLYSVSLPDTKHGWAVGTDGVILHTSDGGKLWKPQQSGIAYSLKGVSFSDSSNGIAVGESGTILVTTDGGATWVPKPPGAFASFTAVLQADAMNAVAIGLSGVAFRTTDGGSSWEQTSVGVVAPLYGISMTDPTHAIAVGLVGTVVTSSDGGERWISRPSGILKNLHDIGSVNNDTAVAVGENGAIIRTDDGGLTWTDISLPDIPGDNNWLSGVAFSPAGTGLIVGKLWRSVGQSTLELTPISRSTDGGITWSTQLISFQPSDPELPPVFLSNHMFSVAFVDSNTAVAVGEFGKILRTTNSGVTWDSVASGTAEHLTSVAFSKSVIGVGTAVGEGQATVLWTTNGGLTWGRVLILGEPLRSVSYGDGTFAVAAGDGGRIMHSSNGGKNWSIISFTGTNKLMVYRTNKNLYGVSVLAGGKITVVGDGGVILGSDSPDIPVRVGPVVEPPLPTTMALHQNYPNPFNPTTAISYQLPAPAKAGDAGTAVSDIRLSIYDIVGREVAVLANERKQAGFYEVKWDASHLPSGMYLCRLSVDGAIFTRKLLLIK